MTARQPCSAPVGDDDGGASLLRAERERAPGAARAEHHHALAGQRARPAAQARLHRVQRGGPVGVVGLEAAVGLAHERVGSAYAGHHLVHLVRRLQRRHLRQ